MWDQIPGDGGEATTSLAVGGGAEVQQLLPRAAAAEGLAVAHRRGAQRPDGVWWSWLDRGSSLEVLGSSRNF